MYFFSSSLADIMSSQPIFKMSPRVKKTHDLLIDNLLIFYMPVGICKCVIFNILDMHKYYCRSFCFFDNQLALVDMVPNSTITLPVLLHRPSTQCDHFGNESFFACALASKNRHMFHDVDVIQEYAYILEEGYSPRNYLSLKKFHWSKFWRPSNSRHSFMTSACRTV